MWKLNKDECTRCGECVRACPAQILELDKGFPYIKPDGICMLCSTCADTCPEQAIELTMDRPAPEGA